jgi:broad specificity phosphatase PhoE
VYVSPLTRALKTASAAPEALRKSMRVLRSLSEIDCGAVDGMPISEVQQLYPELWRENEAQQNENFSWPGGETYRAFRRRVLRAVEAIARRHQGSRVLVVTHAGVINQVLGTLSGQSAARWEFPRPRNASVTGVRWGRAGGAVAFFDDCSHFDSGGAG